MYWKARLGSVGVWRPSTSFTCIRCTRLISSTRAIRNDVKPDRDLVAWEKYKQEGAEESQDKDEIPRSHKQQTITTVELDDPRRVRKRSSYRFSDMRRVLLSSGRGGNGSASFLREAHRPKGPPSGGDGGLGGSVYVQATEHLNSLHRLGRKYSAESGQNGSDRDRHGRRGRDLIIQVPVGTVVKVSSRSELVRECYPAGEGWIHAHGFEEYNEGASFFQELKREVLEQDIQQERIELLQDYCPPEGIDLSEPGEPILLIRGGKGGLGNRNFHTTNIRNPRFCLKGRGGAHAEFVFELKLIADFALVGLPNAGKSTTLSAITRAKPKIGHWAFTTLAPSLGVVMLEDGKRRVTVADMPGLIEGAKFNRGMGVAFLRHIERTKGVVMVIGLDSPNPIKDIETLLGELEGRLGDRKVILVANKTDIAGTEAKLAECKDYAIMRGWDAIGISAMNKINIERLKELMAEVAEVEAVNENDEVTPPPRLIVNIED